MNSKSIISRSILAASLIGLSALSAAAQDKPNLVVYTYDSFIAEWGPGPTLVEAFEETCDCTVDMRGVTDSLNLLTRMRFEGEDTEADVILGLDNNTLIEAEKIGAITEHDVDLTALDMPIEWTSKTFIPYDYGYFSFVYDVDNENIEEAPTSFAAFLEDEDTTIIIQDPRTSTPGLGLLTWIEKIYGDESAEVWKKLNERIVLISPGWGEAYSLFLQGDSDYVLSYTTSPGYHAIAEEDDSYAAPIFEEGHYLQIETAGITKASQNKALANQFLQFLISPAAQSIIAQGNWMYPVVEPDPALPENYPKVPEVPSLMFDFAEVDENRADWIQNWLDALTE